MPKSQLKKKWTTTSEEETEAVGAGIVRDFAHLDPVFLLHGEMGTGKTVLVRGMGFALGIHRREMQSPTYNLVHEHQGRSGRLVHVDLYRLEPNALDGLGLDELLYGPGIKAIEWADRLPERPAVAYEVEIRRRPGGRREIVLSGPAMKPAAT
jgi:tRNA threonylcarbamoyladenosine biosynthesis protein TsaE